MEKRKDINEKFKWDLTAYFKSDEEALKELEAIKKEYPSIERFRGKLDKEEEIVSCLNEKYAIDERFEVLYVYFALRQKEDNTSASAAENVNKVESALTAYGVISSFIDTEIKNLTDEFLTKLKEKYEFKNFFKAILRHKSHILSEKEEKLLAGTGDFSGGFSDNFDMFDDGDLKFGSVENKNGELFKLNHSNYAKFMESEDRVLRKNTFEALHNKYGEFNNFLSANYINNIKKNSFYSRVRGFKSTLSRSIFSEEAEEDVCRTLIDGVRNNINIFHRYFELKKKTLGLDRFAVYDIYSKIKGPDFSFSYEEAIELIKDAVRPLGEEYVSLITRAYEEKWIDVMPSEGKDSGAFSWGAYGKHPVVLLNFVGDMNSVFTLAHELGHCLHSYYSNSAQPYDRAGYTIFVAEVASNVNELLLWNSLKNKANTAQEKLYFLDYFLSQFRGSVHRQTMFAEFEQFAHERHESGEGLSKAILNDYYYDLNKFYFGSDALVPECVKYEWSRIPHFYNAFYVYKYATGIISALVLSEKIIQCDGAEKYLQFLKSGSTKPPIELLQSAGVDLKDAKTFDYAFEQMSKVLDEWETAISK